VDANGRGCKIDENTGDSKIGVFLLACEDVATSLLVLWGGLKETAEAPPIAENDREGGGVGKQEGPLLEATATELGGEELESPPITVAVAFLSLPMWSFLGVLATTAVVEGGPSIASVRDTFELLVGLMDDEADDPPLDGTYRQQ